MTGQNDQMVKVRDVNYHKTDIEPAGVAKRSITLPCATCRAAGRDGVVGAAGVTRFPAGGTCSCSRQVSRDGLVAFGMSVVGEPDAMLAGFDRRPSDKGTRMGDAPPLMQVSIA
jgi:hypothetical protein